VTLRLPAAFFITLAARDFDTQPIPLMFSQAPISVIFVCPKCASVYVATQERRRDKLAGQFDCTTCGAVVHAWSGAYDYPDWRIFKE